MLPAILKLQEPQGRPLWKSSPPRSSTRECGVGRAGGWPGSLRSPWTIARSEGWWGSLPNRSPWNSRTAHSSALLLQYDHEPTNPYFLTILPVANSQCWSKVDRRVRDTVSCREPTKREPYAFALRSHKGGLCRKTRRERPLELHRQV